MRFFLLFILLPWSLVSAQNLSVATSYYNLGQFENAVLAYEAVLERTPTNPLAVVGLVKSYRQLKQSAKAISLLDKSLQQSPERLEYLLELGITYNSLEEKEKATASFEAIITALQKEPRQAIKAANQFKDYNLLSYTIKAYEIAMAYNEHYNFDIEIGRLYGELGNYAGMFDSYLSYMQKSPSYIYAAKRLIDQFIEEDPENEANKILRKTLLKRNQQSPDILNNEMLSWLFVQEKQYRKAFVQERAIYKQTQDGIPQILEIADIAQQNKDYETAITAYEFVIENAGITSFLIKAKRELLNIEILEANTKKYAQINESYLQLIETYKHSPEIVQLQLDYAKFLGFQQDRKSEAIAFLKPLAKKNSSAVDIAKIQLLVGDILVLDGKFNQALIYYTKAQQQLKNHPLAQEASFKIAKTSYYKGDFDWANTQLNVLKESTTQLIANDAMELSLLIYDSTKEESDLSEAALKLYAQGELLLFQGQKEKALEIFEQVLVQYANTAIEPNALYQKALLQNEMQQPALAIENLEKLIQLFPLSLLVDDAYFMLGNLHENLAQVEAAKKAYEKIIFHHADSIHYVDARKAFRKLRGDAVIN